MGSLGETLRQARLDRGVSIVDAEGETRIRRKYLESLEAEDYTALPAAVYTRGFIRTYARYLGLDPDLTLDLYMPARTRDERPVLRSAAPSVSAGRSTTASVYMGVAGVVLLGLLLVYLWTQYTSFVDSLSRTEIAATTAATSSPLPVSAALVPPVPSAAAPVPTAVAAPPAPVAAVAPERGIIIEARVTERTWVEVWTDGSSQLQATLQAGSARSFTADKSIRLRVGNAAAVQVTVNGEPQGSLGEKNQVKEIVWER